MKITQTPNKDLAMGISVDPSLISLLRTGKRNIPKNSDRIRQIALFLASRCTADYQRDALAEMLGQISIRSSIPTEILADKLYFWLSGDANLVEQLIHGIGFTPETSQTQTPKIRTPIPEKETVFYYGESGRREAMRRTTQAILNMNTPGSLLIASDDNMEWLLSDYMLTSQIQSDLMELIKRGFSLHQIMPSMNYINRYMESLHFWLPLYSTGQTAVYYYPRLRDNLYRHSMFVAPGCCVQASTSVGSGKDSNVTLFSTDPEMVRAFIGQFQDYLALCRQALNIHLDPSAFPPCFQSIFSREGEIIQLVNPLSVNTLPRVLLEHCIKESDLPVWKNTFQMYLDKLPLFEKQLEQKPFLDMSCLADADEVRAGHVCIASPFQTYPNHPRYTPETYILHLQNILRLMDRYENYHFLPVSQKNHPDHNLIVNENGMALLIRTAMPPLMLEIHRPEMVLAFQEHLLRIADQKGYDGIRRTKIRLQLMDLIEQLKQ